MARPLRIAYPGAFYHITSRGNERKDIFKSQRDRDLNPVRAKMVDRPEQYRWSSYQYYIGLAVLSDERTGAKKRLFWEPESPQFSLINQTVIPA